MVFSQGARGFFNFSTGGRKASGSNFTGWNAKSAAINNNWLLFSCLQFTTGWTSPFGWCLQRTNETMIALARDTALSFFSFFSHPGPCRDANESGRNGSYPTSPLVIEDPTQTVAICRRFRLGSRPPADESETYHSFSSFRSE